MATKGQIKDWKARLNSLHVEIQTFVELEWNQNMTPDENGVCEIDLQSIQQRESLRHREHILIHLESCVDHLNDIEQFNKKTEI